MLFSNLLSVKNVVIKNFGKLSKKHQRWQGARGAMPPPLPPMLFFVICFIISYYVKEVGDVIAGFCCLFYNRILLNLT